MVDCSFCGKGIPRGTGKMYIKKDGKVFRYCSSKCEKNQLSLGRKARRVNWTEESRSLKESSKA
ncbi:MAG: 50S ribosomal protein L24e [Candidatus Woesearchaeota archaeon]